MEIGYLNLIEGKTYILKSCLIDNGYDQYDLNKKIKEAKSINPKYFEIYSKGKSNKVWILYKSIPENILKQIYFPIKEEVLVKSLKSAIPSNFSIQFMTNYRYYSTWSNERMWNEYVDIYEKYFLDIETINVFARTHAMLEIPVYQIINNKNYNLTEFYSAYQLLPRVALNFDSYKEFLKEIKFCEEFSIEEILLKNIKLKSKNPSLYNIQSAINFIFYKNNKIDINVSRLNVLVELNSFFKIRNIKLIEHSSDSLDVLFEYFLLKKRLFKKDLKSIKNSKSYNKRFSIKNRRGDVPRIYRIITRDINVFCQYMESYTLLKICLVIDTYSFKVICHKTDHKLKSVESLIENSIMSCKVIPDVIKIDELTLINEKKIQNLRNNLLLYGAKIIFDDKESSGFIDPIEEWYSYFNKVYISNIFGYVEGGKYEKTKDFDFYYLHKKHGLKIIISEKIKSYNNSIYPPLEKKPLIVFRKSLKDSNRIINRHDLSLLFGKTKFIEIRNSKIKITVMGFEYSFVVDDVYVAKKYNKRKVMVKYNEFNLFEVKIFTLRGAKLLSVFFDTDMKYSFSLNSNVVIIYQSHRLRNIKMINRNFEHINHMVNEDLITDKGVIKDMRKEWSIQQIVEEVDRLKIKLNVIDKPFFKLNNYYLILEHCQNTIRKSEILFVLGQTGVGKTDNLINYSKSNYENVKYIRLSRSMTSLMILQDVARLFSLKINSRNIPQLVDLLVDFILTKNVKMLLIIDNAIIMKSKVITEEIFEIKKLTNQLLGLVLTGLKSTHKSFQNFLINESYSVLYLENISKKEIFNICNAFNITSGATIEKRFVSVKNIGELLQKIKAYKSSENLSQNYG